MRKTPFYIKTGFYFIIFFLNRSLAYLAIEYITQVMSEYSLLFLPYPLVHAH